MAPSSGSPTTGGGWTVSSIVSTMFPLLLVLSGLEMSAGVVLEALQQTYLGNPTLLILVPVMIGMGGNLGAILSSRLTTSMHLGVLTFEPGNDELQASVVAIVGLALTVFPLLGIVAWVLGRVVLGAPLPLAALLTISVGSGLVLTAFAIVLSLGATMAAYKLGLDPDDTTIPVVTNLCDILGVVVLSVVSLVVL